MSGKLEGKVAFITGAARGQGRSHAIKLASEGADIIAVDLCGQIASVQYAMSTPEDLAETVKEVESYDRRQADVRDPVALTAALEEGFAELGRIDIVLANAGTLAAAVTEADPVQAFLDTIAVNLFGVRNTVHAAVPHMIEQGAGGAIVLTSSTWGLTGRAGTGAGGQEGYVAAKHGVVDLMRSYANRLAQYSIRVNSVHPTGANTPMIMNEAMDEYVKSVPDLANALSANLMPVPVVEPIDVSNAIAWLALRRRTLRHWRDPAGGRGILCQVATGPTSCRSPPPGCVWAWHSPAGP
jgi:SDR family mycofactocin-dependent oxidoreductase